MVMKYNTVGYLGFSVDHQKDTGRDIESKDIRTAILNRLASMTDSELYKEVYYVKKLENE